MGFRDIHIFNLALLAKQGWRILQQPNSLVGRVLKAKYFPHSDFLHASLGHNPSFVWRSILEGRTVLNRGLRQKIGNGELVDIWDSPWLPSDVEPKVTSPVDLTLPTGLVRDLLNEDGHWNSMLISGIFNARDRALISAIPRRNMRREDSWYWHFEKSGCYSVRSGYKAEILAVNSVGPGGTVNWSLIWKLEVAPKIKNFVWRLLSSCLPTMANLASRRSNLPNICPVCETFNEDDTHIFIQCPCAQQVWFSFYQDCRMQNVGQLKDWLWSCLEHPQSKRVSEIVGLLWALWKNRNGVVWEKKQVSPSIIFRQAMSDLQEWNSAQALRSNPALGLEIQSSPARWQRPPSGWYTCNVDAGTFEGRGYCSYGFLVRDASGVCSFASHGAIEVTGGSLLAEALAIKEALSWLKKHRVSNVLVQSDCLPVVQAINQSTTQLSYLFDVISECRVIIEDLECVSISFIKRSANSAAHCLARAVDSMSVRGEWACPPPFLIDVICSDLI